MSRRSVGVNQALDCLLDPQQAAPAGWCPQCGAEIWAEGKELCTRCERHSGVVPLVKEFQHTFTITASMPKLRGLRAWLERNNYQFQEECNANV